MRIVVFLALLVFLGGCYAKPIRHLASDASLIQPGVTTLAEVQRYLGEANGRRQVAPGVVELVFYEDRESPISHAPLIGRWIPPEGYEMLMVTMENDLVTSCELRVFREADKEWMDDFTWDELE
jgi:hypothetical protein